ncbi:hypothetical protein PI124_g21607 [Phytophthora idaei]|nr:hypothetical protein PI125_g23309 [Phytophthora idaei]KAG3128472.1 hypothetical protein PI126_g21386 [Phytophthora idaei]KAG3233319.1 hypothetical protein PI124_g21607 [Phytophthora idaei]
MDRLRCSRARARWSHLTIPLHDVERSGAETSPYEQEGRDTAARIASALHSDFGRSPQGQHSLLCITLGIICIGDKYVAYISRDEDAVPLFGLKLDGPYRDESATATNIARKDYDKMFTLTGNAFHSTTIPEIRSESCYLMDRRFHAQGKCKDAYSYYFNAGRLWPKFVLPWFGLAQMYYERNEFTEAAAYLEKANKAYPENVEILSLLGDVYGKLGKKDEAVVLLRRVVELEPGIVEALIGTTELLHGSPKWKDQIIAIASYVAAEKVMNNTSERVPMEVYANLGVLQQRVGKTADVITCFKKALK